MVEGGRAAVSSPRLGRSRPIWQNRSGAVRTPRALPFTQDSVTCPGYWKFALAIGITDVQFEISNQLQNAFAVRSLKSPCPASIFFPVVEVTGMQIFCKLEYLKRTGSFKERGARNALTLLAPEQQKRGSLRHPQEIHALGVAYHAK